ncbi:MAG: hypothetical protein ACLR0N_11185 [Bilophila wadsworthia]
MATSFMLRADILGLSAPERRQLGERAKRAAETDAETGRNPLGCGTRGPARPVAAARAGLS